MKKFLLPIMMDQRNDLLAEIIKGVLWLFSFFYWSAVVIMRALYKHKILSVYSSPRPVISVGNVTVGGAGKTPVTIWLARQISEHDLNPVILTRGYKSQIGFGSDEALMMERELPKIPVMVSPDRAANIQKAVVTWPVDVFVCDDALQHWKLKRDLNIIVVDAINPFGNQRMLPRGILREPLDVLERADVFLLTKTDVAVHVDSLRQRLIQANPQALIVESCYKPFHLVNIYNQRLDQLLSLKRKSVLAFCAIGDPSSFLALLHLWGAEVHQPFLFEDHHAYTEKDIDRILDFCHSNKMDMCVTTHKDAVKIERFKDKFGYIKFFYLEIELEIVKGKDEFLEKVIDCCKR